MDTLEICSDSIAGLAGLFLLCVAFRLFYVDFVRLSSRPPKQSYFTGKGIESKPLTETIQHVRDEFKAPRNLPRSGFKRAVLVESKRTEIAKLPFFHHDPDQTSDSQEHGEDGMHISLI